jgi:uncharacterized protein YjiS (DUF1127 family)
MQGFEHGTATVSMDIIGAEKNYLHREPASLGTRLRGLFGLWLLWHQRWRQRQHLAGLDAHLLRDIGVTHLAVLRETGKPFWRA